MTGSSSGGTSGQPANVCLNQTKIIDRNIKEPVRQYKMESSYSKNPEFPPGINSLSFEPTIPSKFMVGTEQGGVVITRMQAKAGTNDWVLGEFEKCHQGKVMAVDRNHLKLHQQIFILPNFV